MAVVWFATGVVVLAGVFAAGLGALTGLAILFLRRRAPETVDSTRGMFDWSVTQAALDEDLAAVAITDADGRLVCANRDFTHHFGIAAAPPAMAGDDSAGVLLEELARAAGRDGRAELAPVYLDGGEWRVVILRAGPGGDHLVWRLTRLEDADLADDIGLMIGGKLGRMLGDHGIDALLVDAAGAIEVASPTFMRRANAPQAEIPGSRLEHWIATDARGRIAYAADGPGGLPLRLVELPLTEGEEGTGGARVILLLDAAGPAGDPVAIEGLFSRLPLGLAMADRDGRLLFANPAFARAAGRRQLPEALDALAVADDRDALFDAIGRAASGAQRTADLAVRLDYDGDAGENGDEPVTMGIAAVRGLGDCRVLLTLKDSTEEQRLRRQVMQATKMQAVGQLAGGVAHDFNNVLTAIIGFCDLMLLRHVPGDSDYDDIQQIKANSNRAAALTRQLLAFSRQQTLRPQVLQLPDVVSEISTMLRRLVGETIAFEVEHDRDLAPVRADPGQLEQVIVNLVVNARDAMQGRPDARLRVVTRKVDPADVRALGNDVLPVDDYTALVIEDNGAGIPPEISGKIFEPFFTTKERGRGTGLGLSTVYGIVKQSGGYIFADSVLAPGPGQGTRFTVYLPAYGGAAEQPAPEPLEEAAPRQTAPVKAGDWPGGGRILLVEDEDMVRAVAQRALSRQGYQVTPARDGDEGLAAVEDGGAFDLVVSDVVMPGRDGPSMVRAIRELRPELPILFMSGYAEEQLRREIDLPAVHFLAKPFSVTQIAEAVGEVLATC